MPCWRMHWAAACSAVARPPLVVLAPAVLPVWPAVALWLRLGTAGGAEPEPPQAATGSATAAASATASPAARGLSRISFMGPSSTWRAVTAAQHKLGAATCRCYVLVTPASARWRGARAGGRGSAGARRPDCGGPARSGHGGRRRLRRRDRDGGHGDHRLRCDRARQRPAPG